MSHAGNNKEWQTQWVLREAAVKGVAATSDVLSDLAYNQSGRSNLWHGTAWPDFTPKPVLLLPAEKTLAPGVPPGCDVSALAANVTYQAQVLACADKACTYPNLYVKYLTTLSTNVSMQVMSGDNGHPTSSYKTAAAALLQKFAGV